MREDARHGCMAGLVHTTKELGGETLFSHSISLNLDIQAEQKLDT